MNLNLENTTNKKFYITEVCLWMFISWVSQMSEYMGALLSQYIVSLFFIHVESVLRGTPYTPLIATWLLLFTPLENSCSAWILVSILTFLRLLAMVNMIYSINLGHLYSIMFLFLHVFCLHDIDDAVKNNPIIVLLLIAFNVFEVCDIWMIQCRLRNWEMSIDFENADQETEKIQVISNCSIYER